jgi:hypothetical protein
MGGTWHLPRFDFVTDGGMGSHEVIADPAPYRYTSRR